MTRILIGALLAAIAAGDAAAADLPSRAGAPFAPIYAAPAFTWTGVYLGLNGGGGWGNTGSASFGNLSGGVFGVTGGANYQINQFVLGGEADLDWAGVGHTRNVWLASNRMNVNTIMTVRARAGFAFNRALLFVTGGFAGVNAQATISTAVPGWAGSQSQWISGASIGGGVEYAFTDNVTAKAEYLYLPLSSTNFFTSPLASTRAPENMSLLRAGVNYKF